MNNDIILEIDKRRVLGSIFWIIGALLMFGASIDTYRYDLKNRTDG